MLLNQLVVRVLVTLARLCDCALLLLLRWPYGSFLASLFRHLVARSGVLLLVRRIVWCLWIVSSLFPVVVGLRPWCGLLNFFGGDYGMQGAYTRYCLVHLSRQCLYRDLMEDNVISS